MSGYTDPANWPSEIRWLMLGGQAAEMREAGTSAEVIELWLHAAWLREWELSDGRGGSERYWKLDAICDTLVGTEVGA